MEKMANLITTRRLGIIAITVAVLLLIPFIAMQFSENVNWTTMDFLVMGVLLLGTGLAANIILQKVKNVNYRDALLLIIMLAFFLIWAELAVGIFNSPLAGS